MTARHLAPATVPPPGIAGLQDQWSRLVAAPDHLGVERTWHILDHTGGDRSSSSRPDLTILCVHGNPSWSFLWRNVVAQAPDGVRVVAVDQLDMGYSERTGVVRRLANRVEDLCELTKTLGIDGPVVTIAHDWGGPVSLGWALRHLDQLRGVVLTNTAVHQPEGSPAPTVIRATRLPMMLKRITVTTPAFVHGAIEMARPRIDPGARAGFMAPYQTAERREAIETFVEDIPLDPDHPTAAPLDAIADGLDQLANVPTLLLWGPADPVFSDLYLHDFEARLPHAKVHRFAGASHFVSEQADVVGAFYRWLDGPEFAGQPLARPADPATRSGLNDQLDALANSGQAAVVELATADATPTVAQQTFGELHDRVTAIANGLVAQGVAPGDRVALMIPPGIDLSAAVYACWRIGAVMVLVDSGLGPRNMRRAMASANPAWIIGIDKALLAARSMRWPGRRIAVTKPTGRLAKALGPQTDLETLAKSGAPQAALDTPSVDHPAAIVFTSGSTGPSKGVGYTHGQIQAQRDTLAGLYNITPDDRLVAAFAPFALYGPAFGITSVVPDMDITKPGTLTATSLAAAVSAVDATLVFASPAALENVLATADELTEADRVAFANVRLVLSAGAPVPLTALQASAELFPNAEAHTPYGMTELLPAANIALYERLAARSDAAGEGVCVGQPAPGVTITIDPLNNRGEPVGHPATTPDVLGEIVVSAAHQKQTYDRLWYTESLSRTADGHHRTGDVGSLDSQGRLWVAGRLQHIITTPAGPIAPVASEQAVEQVEGISRAAVVGVGPAETQLVVVVIESSEANTTLKDRSGLRLTVAGAELADQVRAAAAGVCGADIAAVLVANKIPTDRRHNSKVDRSAVADRSAKLLEGS